MRTDEPHSYQTKALEKKIKHENRLESLDKKWF